jgi:hypothetical protein
MGCAWRAAEAMRSLDICHAWRWQTYAVALGREMAVPAPDSDTGGKLTLLVCHLDDGGLPPHACKRAQRALRAAGHDFEKIVAARGVLFGLFTTGRRPRLRQLSGQERLPVLRLPDGTTVNGSANIIAWANDHRPASTAASAPDASGGAW